ncbi:MAG: methyltransferase domain-containing protein [Candidatus Limnocylindrales bacterium]
MPEPESLGRCRSCATALLGPILDLGSQPSADALVDPDAPRGAESAHWLALGVCPRCWLVQLAETGQPPGPAHGHGTAFSSSTLDHVGGWAAELLDELKLDASSLVVDIAAGSGHLLAPFRAAGLRVWAMEADPAMAEACRAAEIRTSPGPFGAGSATALRSAAGPADLVLVNHALAHVDDLADATSGIALLLKPSGTVAIEFHHLLSLVVERQFDAVCHAHRTYLSLTALRPLLDRHGLRAIDARPMAAHGGSLRVLAVGAEDAPARSTSEGTARLEAIVEAEHAGGLDRLDGFADLGPAAAAACDRIRSFLEAARAGGLKVAGYGAPSRAATLCNTAGITSALLPFTVDRSPDKQGRSLPGCRIPIRDPAAIEVARPDLILILPWTLREEIVEQLAVARTWGGRFVVALPELRLFS